MKPLHKQDKPHKSIVQKMGGLKSQYNRYKKHFRLLSIDLAGNDFLLDINPKILYNPKKWEQIKAPKIKWDINNIEELRADGLKLYEEFTDIETQIKILQENRKIKKEEMQQFITKYKKILKQYDYLQKMAMIQEKLEALKKQYKNLK